MTRIRVQYRAGRLYRARRYRMIQRIDLILPGVIAQSVQWTKYSTLAYRVSKLPNNFQTFLSCVELEDPTSIVGFQCDEVTLALQTNVDYLSIGGTLHGGGFLCEVGYERNRTNCASFQPDSTWIGGCGVGRQDKDARWPLRNTRGNIDGGNQLSSRDR